MKTPDTHSTATSPQARAQEQQPHFDAPGFPETPRPPRPRKLTLKISNAKNGAPLGKTQKTFNRLISQIGNLRAAIDTERRHLDAALRAHAQTLHPLRRQIAARRAQLAIFAHTHLKTAPASFSKNQRRTLRAFISAQLQQIIGVEGDLADEKLQAIFTDIEGMTPREARRQEMDADREDMEQEMKDYGMDIDLSAFSKDMTPEEFARAAADVMQQFKKAGLPDDAIPPEFRHLFSTDNPDPAANAAAGAAAKPRKKTKKQQEREAREKALEEARARSLSSIYKQLARVFHPDLEPDPALKKQKETLMQQLTVAYRANDMHTLLRLELEWLRHGEHDIERLGEEKLAVYNEVLREQVAALQDEQNALPHEPRYEALRPYATGMFGSLATFNAAKEEEKLRNILKFISEPDTSATGAAAIKILKPMLADFSKEMTRNAQNQAIDEMMADAMDEMMNSTRAGRPWR